MIDIDLVFTYCDGDDQEFILKKSRYTQNIVSESNPSIRFNGINEIYYSIKTVLKFMPWIRTIFIVTDNQFLDFTHPKIKYVQHKDIIPNDLLPVYFSDVIESYLHNIPNLSEIFIYNNDDCFHMDYIQIEDIIEPDSSHRGHGVPAFRCSEHHRCDRCDRCDRLPGTPCGRSLPEVVDSFAPESACLKIINNFNLNKIKEKTSEYANRILYTVNLLDKTDLINNHHSKILRKSTLYHLEKKYSKELEKLRNHRFRERNLIQYMFLAINEDHSIHSNIILSPKENCIEYHFGNEDYNDTLEKRFCKDFKYKFACYNSMNTTYKYIFYKMMEEILYIN
jgi:hypothetical protein